MSKLQEDLTAAAWAVSFGLGGGAVGVAVDNYIYPWIAKTMGAQSYLKHHIKVQHLVATALDLGLGVVLLGSMLKYVIPADVESPVGESILIFFFFVVQSNLIRSVQSVLLKYLVSFQQDIAPPAVKQQQQGDPAVQQQVQSVNQQLAQSAKKAADALHEFGA